MDTILDAFGNILVRILVAGVPSLVMIWINRLKGWKLSPLQITVYAVWLFVGILVAFPYIGLEPSLRYRSGTGWLLLG